MNSKKAFEIDKNLKETEHLIKLIAATLESGASDLGEHEALERALEEYNLQRADLLLEIAVDTDQGV